MHCLAQAEQFVDRRPTTVAGPRPKNADFPLLKVERPCCDVEEGARLKGK